MHYVQPATAGEIVVAVTAVHDIRCPGAIQLIPAGAAIEQAAGVAATGLDDVVAVVAIVGRSGRDAGPAVDRVVIRAA